MDEKPQDRSFGVTPPASRANEPPSARQFIRAFCAGLLIALFTSYTVLNYYGLSMTDVFSPYQSIFWDNSHSPTSIRPCHRQHVASAPFVKKVALEAHIMSKCPDARDCLRDLIVPTMANASDKVDFKLSYIGQLTDSDTILCKHGPSECLGNILELCSIHLSPSSPKRYLGFTNCLSQSYSHIPERSLIQECALEHGIDFEELNDCASRDDGAFGMGLLRESVKRTEDAGVTKSCTVRLNGKVRCVRDGGRWYDCEGGSEVGDLVRDIKKLVM